MDRREFHLTTPINATQTKNLRLDDIVYIDGTIFTIRDWSHQRIAQLLQEGKKEAIPFHLQGMGILHCGPIMTQKEGRGWEVVSAGPTSSSRFSSFIPVLLKGLHPGVMIGKGHLDEKIIGDLVQEKCVFLQAVGGCAALYASQIQKVRNCYWPEFGMVDAVWEFEVKNFGPLSVEIDLKGNSSYRLLREKKLLKNLDRVYKSAGLPKHADYIWWPKVSPGSKEAFDYATEVNKKSLSQKKKRSSKIRSAS